MSDEKTDTMRIVRLEAENVKILKAVDITPQGDVVEITGSNGAGKSSILNSITLALAGREAAKDVEKALRNGEEKGYVTLDLGDLIVTRTFTEKGGNLTVKNAEGAKFGSPQQILDSLRAKFIDPAAFIDLSAKDQREALLKVIDLGFDLDEHEAERKKVFTERTDVGREGRKYGEIGTVDETLPEVEVSASVLLSEIQSAQEVVSEYRKLQDSVERHKQELADFEERVTRLRASVAAEEEALAKHSGLPDVKALTDRLSSVEDTNAAIRANNAIRRKQAEVQELYAKHEKLTQKLEALDKKKFDALASADLPVEGLGVEEDGITLDGVPFKDASTAQKLVAALKIASAGSPKLKVITIQRGESLDDNSFAAVQQFASDTGTQIWFERVGEGRTDTALIIEDGEIV